jgi:hypothetical protein
MPSDDERVRDEFTPSHESKIPEQEEAHPAEPHSIYTPAEKWFIVALIGFGGLFRYFLKFDSVGAAKSKFMFSKIALSPPTYTSPSFLLFHKSSTSR